MADTPVVTTTPTNTNVTSSGGSFNYAHNETTDSAIPTPPANNLIVTAKPAQAQFTNASSKLSSYLANLNQTPGTPNTDNGTNINIGNYSDKYTQMLDKVSQTSDASTKALISSIQAQRANRGNEINTQYDNYKRGLQLLGIQHNETQFTPDLLQGHIKQAENDRLSKIQSLDVAENKALMDAQDAQSKQDLSTLKDKMDYIDKIKADKKNALKDYYDNLTTQSKIGDIQAANIYDKLQTLNEGDKEKYLVAVAQKYGLPVDTLTNSVANVKNTRETQALDIQEKQAVIAEHLKNVQSGGILTQTVLNSLKKANPLLDLSYGATKEEALQASQIATAIPGLFDKYYQDQNNLGPQGYFTYDFIKNSIDNLPDGIDKVGFLTDLFNKGQLTPNLDKKGNYEGYGITKEEAQKIMGQ